jgi:hypothetical protein
LYEELSLGFLAMLFAYCDEAKQILTGHVVRQEQRFFHPLGEASKLKNKPNLGWGRKLATQFLGQSFPIAFAKHSR